VTRSLGIVFLGNDRWSVPSLRALAGSDHRLDLVVTRVPRPAGRGSELTPTHVANAASEADLPMLEVETVMEGPGFDAIATSAPDVLVVVAYGEILPAAVLALPGDAPVNRTSRCCPGSAGQARCRPRCFGAWRRRGSRRS
jgi:methionyl-tRNA formyltransferase